MEQVRPDTGAALLDLYDDALPQVYGYLLARCGGQALAEDLTAETFLAAVAACRRTAPPAPSVGWLVGIARHKLCDHWRDRSRAAERERLGVLDSAEPTDPWDEHLDAMLARQVLDHLTGIHRAALTLRCLDGLPVREVAGVLGRTPTATEALLGRARAAFRRRYTALGEGGRRS